MEILAKKKIFVPHWHIPLVTAVCLVSGIWVGSNSITAIGIFFAGLQCSFFLPIWKEAKSEKDFRFLANASKAKGIRFWYHALPVMATLLAAMAIVAKLIYGTETP
ncbi:TPA: hypothetical protein ACGSTL_001388 [Vibrio parahaemolyticus]